MTAPATTTTVACTFVKGDFRCERTLHWVAEAAGGTWYKCTDGHPVFFAKTPALEATEPDHLAEHDGGPEDLSDICVRCGAHARIWRDEPCVPVVAGTGAEPPTGRLVRKTDRPAARQAALALAPKLGRIQRRVLEAFRDHGPMTTKTCEALPEFSRYGRSTVQKRISELAQRGVLELVPGAKDASYRVNEARIDDPLTPERCPSCGRALPREQADP